MHKKRNKNASKKHYQKNLFTEIIISTLFQFIIFYSNRKYSKFRISRWFLFLLFFFFLLLFFIVKHSCKYYQNMKNYEKYDKQKQEKLLKYQQNHYQNTNQIRTTNSKAQAQMTVTTLIHQVAIIFNTKY